MEKKGIDIKSTPGYIQYADVWKKTPFYVNVPDLTSFFLQDFYSCDLVSWQPKYYFRKKDPGISNSELYFQFHFVLGLQKIRTFLSKFLFPDFFPETFFPVTFLHGYVKTYVIRFGIKILIRSFSANTQPIWKRRDTRGTWKTQVCFYYYLTLIFNRYNWYVHITWPELPPMSVHYHYQLCLRKVLKIQNQAKNVPVGLLSSPIKV